MTSHLPLTVASQVNIKMPIQFKYDFPHLENGDIFTNTASWAMTKLENRASLVSDANLILT